MDLGLFGFFEFAPDAPLDCDFVGSLLEAAVEQEGGVDAVILPEAAVRPETIDGLEHTLAEHGATFLIAGVREPPAAASFGRNLWPSRYSGVLADDPGCAVLTLTSYGMAARCRPPGRRRSRVVAHWNSQADGPHEVELERGASGVLVSASVQESTLWRADGRCHRDVPQLRLSGVRQLRATRAGGRRQAVASR